MRITMFLGTQKRVRKRRRKLSLIQQASFPRMHSEDYISVRVKRTQSHDHQRRRGQNQGVSRKGTFQASFQIRIYRP
jgi:hypothetical protein